MGLRKCWILLAVVLALGMSLTGCMRNVGGDDVAGATDAPTNMPNFMPQNTQTDASANAPFDWTKNAAQIEGQIGRISEINECRVVTAGNTALVGVKFDKAYGGQLTERIREMVAAEILAADPSIQTVAVTADAEDVKTVYELSDRMLSNEKADTLKEDVGEIVRNATTLR